MSEDFCEADDSVKDYGLRESFQKRFSGVVVPVLVAAVAPQGVNARLPRVQALACSSIARFCQPEHCGREQLPEAGARALLAPLYELLRDSPWLSVKEESLAAVANIATVIGPGFAGFYDAFLPLATAILADATSVVMRTISGGGDGGGGGRGHCRRDGPNAARRNAAAAAARLRGNAMEFLALMGRAVGRARFEGDARAAMALLLINSPGAAALLAAAARIGGVMGRGFSRYLDALVPRLLRIAAMDASFRIVDTDITLGGGSDDDDDGVEAFNDRRQTISINTSAAQDKEAACRALFQFCVDLGAAFAPFAADVLVALVP
ncbi:unnamed protein product, partial [Phaeothamnion confervicola]